MTNTTVFYEFLVRGDASGNVAGSQFQERTIYQDDSGAALFEKILPPVPVAQADAAALATAAGAINTASLATIDSLQAQLTAAQAAKAADDATIAQFQAQLASAALATPAADSSDTLLGDLNAAFATIPAEYQAQFANSYATVRVLIQADQPALAATVVQGLTVPDALAAIKTQILALLALPANITSAPAAALAS